MDFQVSLTPQAERDLERIGRHIARDNVQAARTFCGQLMLEAKSLKSLPRRGFTVRRQPKIRRLVFKTYLIFYKIFEDEGRVEILRFWHSKRDQGRLRLKEEVSPAYALSPDTAPAIAS